MSDPTITRRQFYQALARLLTRRAQAPRPAEYAGLRPAEYAGLRPAEYAGLRPAEYAGLRPAAPSAPPVRPARA